MYVGNTNTNRLHDPNCRAVGMIADKHRVYTESGEGFHVLCKWCGNQGYRKRRKQMNFDEITNEIMDMPGIKVCHDKELVEIMEKVGCIDYNLYHKNKKSGTVLMYPHPDGIRVVGEEGRWWVFYQCGECGYQTNYRKAFHKIHVEQMKERGEI